MSENHSIDFPVCFPVEYRGLDGLRFPGYCVGDDGSVWSRWKKGLRGADDALDNKWHRVRSKSKRVRYKGVTLVRPGGEHVSFSVHSLVLRAFRGEAPEGCQARHLNGNPRDNRLSNLMWGTPKENAEDKIRHGRSLRGEKGSNAILTEEKVREIRKLIIKGVAQVKIARMFGVSQPTVSAIKVGRIWGHLL